MTDVDTGLSIAARLDLALGRMTDSFDALCRHSAARPGPPLPIDYPLRSSGTSLANGKPVALDLGGPSQGRQWEVRRLVVGGSTWSTAIAGIAAVYISPTKPLDASGTLINGSLMLFIDEAATLPLPAFYGSHEVVLNAPNRLWVVFSGQAAAQTIIAAGSAEDVAFGPNPQGYAL